jgi:hypothetical protein
MPTKHQTDSYRTIGGVRWPCWGDLCDEAQEREAAELRRQGIRLRIEQHAGYKRAFVHPDDRAELGRLSGINEVVRGLRGMALAAALRGAK